MYTQMITYVLIVLHQPSTNLRSFLKIVSAYAKSKEGCCYSRYQGRWQLGAQRDPLAPERGMRILVERNSVRLTSNHLPGVVNDTLVVLI